MKTEQKTFSAYYDTVIADEIIAAYKERGIKLMGRKDGDGENGTLSKLKFIKNNDQTSRKDP